ncbi:hypothetical protein MMC14_007247 [Varicellaria rhodocarpa]|nr:hypothetical protein [Varicellaria rhodocarpa]
MAPMLPKKRRKLSLSESSAFKISHSAEADAPFKIPYKNGFFTTSASRWNLEQNYENQPRKAKKKETENTRLPIKTPEGRIEQLRVSEIKEGDEDSSLGSGEEEKPVVEEVEQPEAQRKISPRQDIIKAKEELARIATLISEDPEEHAGGFRILAQIATSHIATIKRLALATQLAVYKDVIPGYRIRPIAESDVTEKISKDVRRLRAFEQSLVGSYQHYVKELAKYSKLSRGDVSEGDASLAALAISCTCALLLAVPHFNFRTDLIKILVEKLGKQRVDADFIKCCETLETLFRNDDDGTPSLDAVTMVIRMMKSKCYHVDESVLNTFLHLRLLSEFSSKASQNHVDRPSIENGLQGKKPKFKKEFRTNKQKKIFKERRAVEKEFKEADAVVSHEERDRMQAETLKLVFVAYFRILKAQASNLMGAVLEGLARYAHLINQDFFGDILEALKELTTIGDTSTEDATEMDGAEGDEEESLDDFKLSRDATRESLLCVITAFALLEGQEASKVTANLNLELSFFIAYLYRTLHALTLNPDIELNSKSLHLPDPHATNTDSHSPTANNKINIQTTIVLLLRSLSSILLPPTSTRSVPPIRIAAFSKQLLTSSLQLPEKSAVAMMGLMNKVTKTHGRKISGMWNTEERKGDGLFEPIRPDLEGSNPFASTIWEGELLRLHYCPGVREGVKGLEKGIEGIR